MACARMGHANGGGRRGSLETGRIEARELHKKEDEDMNDTDELGPSDFDMTCIDPPSLRK